MFNIKHNNKQLWYYKKNDMFNIKHNNKELWYYKKNEMFNTTQQQTTMVLQEEWYV